MMDEGGGRNVLSKLRDFLYLRFKRNFCIALHFIFLHDSAAINKIVKTFLLFLLFELFHLLWHWHCQLWNRFPNLSKLMISSLKVSSILNKTPPSIIYPYFELWISCLFVKTLKLGEKTESNHIAFAWDEGVLGFCFY